MNYKNNLKILVLLVSSILFVCCGTTKSAQERAEDMRDLRERIENRDFIFTADYAYPQNYQPIHLSPSSYDVTVSPDTVKAYLPYYGRAYRAPIGSSDAGIKFESTEFEYTVHSGKRSGEWIVTINTTDTRKPYKLIFKIWDNGNAQLTVYDQDRQSITFNGSINENNKKAH